MTGCISAQITTTTKSERLNTLVSAHMAHEYPARTTLCSAFPLHRHNWDMIWNTCGWTWQAYVIWRMRTRTPLHVLEKKAPLHQECDELIDYIRYNLRDVTSRQAGNMHVLTCEMETRQRWLDSCACMFACIRSNLARDGTSTPHRFTGTVARHDFKS